MAASAHFASEAARHPHAVPDPLVLAIEIGGTLTRVAASRGGAPAVVRLPTPNYLDTPTVSGV